MYDSRTDAPHKGTHWTRHYRIEAKTIGYDHPSVGGVLYRMEHQASALTVQDWLREIQDDAQDAVIALDGITGLPPFPARMTCTWEMEWDEEYGYLDCCHECACGCDTYYAHYDAMRLVEAIFPSVIVEENCTHLTPKVAGAIATSESIDYDPLAKHERARKAAADRAHIQALIDEEAWAANKAERNLPTRVKVSYGSLRQVTTRR